MLCRICTVQIQPREHVLDDAGHTAPTRQHELEHTDHTDHTDQEYIYLADLDHDLIWTDLYDVSCSWLICLGLTGSWGISAVGSVSGQIVPNFDGIPSHTSSDLQYFSFYIYLWIGDGIVSRVAVLSYFQSRFFFQWGIDLLKRGLCLTKCKFAVAGFFFLRHKLFFFSLKDLYTSPQSPVLFFT